MSEVTQLIGIILELGLNPASLAPEKAMAPHSSTLAWKILCPWDFLGKNTGVGCHFPLQGIFPTRGSNLCLLRWQAGSLQLSQQLVYQLAHGKNRV